MHFIAFHNIKNGKYREDIRSLDRSVKMLVPNAAQGRELDHNPPRSGWCWARQGLREAPGTPSDPARRLWRPPGSTPHMHTSPSLRSHTQLGFSILAVCMSYLFKARLSRPCFSFNTSPFLPPPCTQPSSFYIAFSSLTRTGRLHQ